MQLAQLTNFLKHSFTPQVSNNYKARLLHPSLLTAILLFVVLFQNVITFTNQAGFGVLGYAANISPSEVIRLTNEKRAQNGLPALKENSLLTQAAQEKAKDMLEKDYWAHVSPEGKEPWAFFAKVGYSYRYAGENLARDFNNPVSAVDAWMASASHRENMLSGKYQEIGIAVIEGDMSGSDTTIIVQLFGTKQSDIIPTVPVASARNTVTQPEASPSPIPSPEATPSTLIAGNEVLKPLPTNTKVSPFQITRAMSLWIVLGLMGILIVDAAIVARKRISRVAGRAFAHISFMGMILAILIIARAGEIF